MIVVVAPDSFKGCLGATAAAQAMARGVWQACPEAEIRFRPLADGGEGTLDAMLAATGGERRAVEVMGAHGETLRAEYGVIESAQGLAAILEVAQVVGLTLPGVSAVPVARRSTRGVGELVQHCLALGLRRFKIGLGGSATNDGGAGMLAALGVRWLNARGEIVTPDADGLASLVRADFSGLDARLAGCEISLLSDVDNPLCGVHGATAVFGPQKGVATGDIVCLDRTLRHFAEVCERWAGAAISKQPGSGAAGGLGYAFRLLGAENCSGAEAICELVGLDDALRNADWLLTGEGRSDRQTPRGKAPWVAARHARQFGVEASLISGIIDLDALSVLSAAFVDCLALARDNISPELAMKRAADLLAERAEEATRKRLRKLPM